MVEKRAYRLGARAASAAETRERVMDAAERCFGELDYDAVSLRMIAKQAGVGLQTVVRAAKSKDALFGEVAERFLMKAASSFDVAATGDWHSALDALLAFHETYGDQTMRIMAHEHRVPAVGAKVRRSRELQAAWIVAHHPEVFADDDDEAKQERLAVVLALTGGRFWYTLRRDHGLSAEATRRAIERQLFGLLGLEEGASSPDTARGSQGGGASSGSTRS